MVGSKFRVWALPTLILIRPDGSIITRVCVLFCAHGRRNLTMTLYFVDLLPILLSQNGRRIVNMLDRYPWDDLSDGVCSGCNII